MTADTVNPFNTYMNMVTAVAVTVGLVTGYFRDRRLEKSNTKVATAVATVAIKAEKVADAVLVVKDDMATSKEEVATHREDEKLIFGNIQSKVDATHAIVNAQKTAMMRKLADSQLFTLTLAQAMLEDKPHSQKLKDTVAAAQALYNDSVKDLEIKQVEEQHG